MEENQGYVIQKSVLFDNGRGFVLAESQTAPAPFVTWQFTEEQGRRDYYWGHYHTDKEIAEKDYSSRVSDYQRRYGVWGINNSEVKGVFRQLPQNICAVHVIRYVDAAGPLLSR